MPGHRRIAPTGLPKERAYPRSPDPRSQNPGRFCAGTPAPREGSFDPWPPESGRDTTGGPRLPEGKHPAGRNFGKEGATPSIRPCPRKPFARDPVQRGGSERSIGQGEAAGISWGKWWGIRGLGGRSPVAPPCSSPRRGEGGAQRRMRGLSPNYPLLTPLRSRIASDAAPLHVGFCGICWKDAAIPGRWPSAGDRTCGTVDPLGFGPWMSLVRSSLALVLNR